MSEEVLIYGNRFNGKMLGDIEEMNAQVADLKERNEKLQAQLSKSVKDRADLETVQAHLSKQINALIEDLGFKDEELSESKDALKIYKESNARLWECNGKLQREAIIKSMSHNDTLYYLNAEKTKVLNLESEVMITSKINDGLHRRIEALEKQLREEKPKHPGITAEDLDKAESLVKENARLKIEKREAEERYESLIKYIQSH